MGTLALGALSLSWILLAAAATPQEAPLAKEQQEVWSREEAYRNAVQSRDANAFIALLHEDFVGWPYFEQQPIRKADFRKAPFRKFWRCGGDLRSRTQSGANLRRHGRRALSDDSELQTIGRQNRCTCGPAHAHVDEN
jgi:hypothetical protein